MVDDKPLLKGIKMAKLNLKSWAAIFAFSFFAAANDADHVEPVFNEAASGEDDGGGVGWHKMAPMGIPGAKFHAMTGQSENTQQIRANRGNAKGATATALGRPDYYESFEGVNSFKM